MAMTPSLAHMLRSWLLPLGLALALIQPGWLSAQAVLAPQVLDRARQLGEELKQVEDGMAALAVRRRADEGAALARLVHGC